MKLFPHLDASQELQALAQTFNVHDVLVSARCFRVSERKPYYEIVLNGRGEFAIVDIAASDEAKLPERIEHAAVSFAAAIELRSKS